MSLLSLVSIPKRVSAKVELQSIPQFTVIHHVSIPKRVSAKVEPVPGLEKYNEPSGSVSIPKRVSAKVERQVGLRHHDI